MIALVTGGAGFIGSHLTRRLVAAGYRVRILDNLSTGRTSNLDGLDDDQIELHRGSVMDDALVQELVASSDVVFHLAAAVGVKLVVEQPTLTIETNVRGTDVVLRAAARHGKRVLLASSSEVYGKGTKIPFAEDDDLRLGPTVKARWRYACSKAMDEYLAFAYAQERDLSVVIARLFNTVGPGQVGRYGMVLPTFVRQGLAGEAITVYGPGTQTRCFAAVDQVVECLLRLIEQPTSLGEVFNVGSRRETAIADLAKVVQARTSDRSTIVRVPYAEAYGPGFEDLERRLPDLTKLERTIGFVPDRPIEAIVDAVIDHARRSTPAD